MKCLNCNHEIENDDNFCPNCGHWTARGYKSLNNQKNVDKLMQGNEIKRNTKLSTLFSLLFISVITFVFMLIVRGNSLFKPIIYIKKQIDNYRYGYSISVMKTNNTYDKLNINSIDDAKEIIKKDFDKQKWQCTQESDVSKLERKLETDFSITSVDFCDIPYEEAKKIADVITKMHNIFPGIQGSLTNITVSNANTKSEYIAYFQPMYQFVNSLEDINTFNKVNKTQILLNSYYFLNTQLLENDITNITGEGWYVNDSTWESTIAHELGHYITFKLFLNENNLDNITFITHENERYINEIMEKYDSGTFSRNIVTEALNNYNAKYNTNLNIYEYAGNISKYAAVSDKNHNLLTDETIAEAIHDYYLHNDNCHKESYEIIKIINNKM